MVTYIENMIVKTSLVIDHLMDLKEAFFTIAAINMKLNLTKSFFGL
jgi:hypothetical protein